MAIPRYRDSHLHLGYYENSHDFEAVAFQQEENDKWDVYFDDSGVSDLIGYDQLRDSNFGIVIFSEPCEDNLRNRFHDWVVNVLLTTLKI